MLRSLALVSLVLASLSGDAVASLPATGGRLLLPGCSVGFAGEPIGEGCPAGLTDDPGSAIDAGCAVPGVDDRCERVVHLYDSGSEDMTSGDLAASRLVTPSADGELILTLGASDRDPAAARRRELVVNAIDAEEGTRAWAVTYPSTVDTVALTLATQGDLGFAIGSDPAGACQGGAIRVVAFDVSDGSHRWTKVVQPAPGGCFLSPILAEVGDGHLILGYSHMGVDGHFTGVALALEFDGGSPAWSHALVATDPMFNVGTSLSAMHVSASGQLLVAGSGMGTLGVGGIQAKHQGWLIQKLDPEAGAVLMATEWAVPRALLTNAPANPPVAIRQSPDGEKIFVAGAVELQAGASFDIIVRALDHAGSTLWMGSYDGPRSAHVTNPAKKQASFDSLWYHGAMEILPDGDVAVTGYSSSEVVAPGLWYDFATLRFSGSDGALRWANRYSSETYLNWIPSLELTPDGSTIVVNGQSRIDAILYGAKSTTLAYDAASGQQRWVARFSQGHTFPHGLAMSLDGSTAFVAASSAEINTDYVPGRNYPGYDIVTLGYDVS